MKYDQYGRGYCSTDELCDQLYISPELNLENFLVEDPEQYNNALQKFHLDFLPLQKFIDKTDNFQSVEDFHAELSSNWYMPEEYKNLDIAQYILSCCKQEHEFQRVGEELLLYHERNLFDLLKFLKYLVDTLRSNNIVWGVGRGSSVSSYVLYLLGVHKINSIYYDLDIKEFLK